MSDSVHEFMASIASLHDEPEVYSRDLSFHPRTVEEWREYTSERSAICQYLAGLSREQADAAALAMAGPMPGDWAQQGLQGMQPRSGR